MVQNILLNDPPHTNVGFFDELDTTITLVYEFARVTAFVFS